MKYLLAGLLFAAQSLQAQEVKIINGYSQEIRNFFEDDEGSLTVRDVSEIIFQNMGIATLIGDDVVALNSAIRDEVGRVPSQFAGKDRWVVPEALEAAEKLKKGRFLNLFIQSADLKKFLNTTERVLSRKYTTTNRPDYEYFKKQKEKREQ